MAVRDLKAKLQDRTFLLGAMRRRAAMRDLAASADPAAVIVLAEALVSGHPEAAAIADLLGAMSPTADGAKVSALWSVWAKSYAPVLAEVLCRLPSLPLAHLQTDTIREVLALDVSKAGPAVTQAATAFAPAAAVLVQRGAVSDLALLVSLVESNHPAAKVAAGLLADLSLQAQADKVEALWDLLLDKRSAKLAAILAASPHADGTRVAALWAVWAGAPTAALAKALCKVPALPLVHLQPDTVRAVLALDLSKAAPAVTQAVTAFAPAAAVLVQRGAVSDLALLVSLVESNHPAAKVAAGLLAGLSPQTQADKVRALWNLLLETRSAKLAAILAASPQADGARVAALWAAWATSPTAALAEILCKLLSLPLAHLPPAVVRSVLGLELSKAAPAVTQAVTAFAPAAAVLVQRGAVSDLALLVSLVESNHPAAKVAAGLLAGLSPQTQADKVEALWNLLPETRSAKLAAILAASPQADGARVAALWAAWATSPTAALAEILCKLSSLPLAHLQPAVVRSVLGLDLSKAAPAVTQAVTVFGPAVAVLVERGALSDLPLLASLVESNHPAAKVAAGLLAGLSPQTQADKVEALWNLLLETRSAKLAPILASLGWPAGHEINPKRRRDTLAIAKPGCAEELMQAVVSFAGALPVNDESANDEIFGAWMRLQSPALQELIAVQRRHPGSPALDALHALVCGDLPRYGALNDANGHLFVQAYEMASPDFRARIRDAVAGSPDRQLREAFRRAQTLGTADAGESIENLKRIGDEDGVFELTRGLRLMQVLEICERWAGTGSRPTDPRSRAVVERALEAYGGLGRFEVELGPPLPDGLVDIFDWWRSQAPTDEQVRADLHAPDPFLMARGLYLGRSRGLVDDARLRAAATSDHWPERLVARLLEPSLLADAKPDHVFWVSACAGDASLLQAPIGGTPDDYARYTAMLKQARGPAAARSRALLEILCAFQSVFAVGETYEEVIEATEAGAVELEDAPRVDF